MAEKTDTPKVHQHLLSDDERSKWTVVDIAVVSPTSVTALLQNNQEWCIDTFDCDENEYQRSKRICLQTNLKEPPLHLSYVHVENKLKHFVCTKTKLHLIDDESESIEKSVSLSAEPSALCVEDNKVYISTNETKTLMFFKLELPTDTSIINLKEISEHDSIAEFVVHSKNIYVCTKGGKVSSYKETGEKQHDYRNIKSENSKARGLAVFTPQGKECNLLLVTWNDNTLFIYSTITSHDLLNIELNVPGKFKFTTSCFLMSSKVNNVAVYKMKAVADRGTFKMILVSGSREGELSYLHDFVLHATTTTVPVSRNFFIKREKLKTLVQMYDHSCNTRELIDAEKRKASIESDDLRRMNKEKEEKCCSLTKQLETERQTTEELKLHIDRSKEEKDDVTEKLENTISNLSRKELELSDVKAKLDTAENARETLEQTKALLEQEKEYLTKLIAAEERNGKELKESLSKAETSRKSLEETKATIEKEKEDLTKQLATEERNGREVKESLSKTENARKALEQTKALLEKEKEYLTKLIAAEERKQSLSKNISTKYNNSTKSSLLQLQIMIDKQWENLFEYSKKVNQLYTVQRKPNNEDTVKGRSKNRGRRRYKDTKSSEAPKMKKQNSTKNMGTPVKKRQQEEIGYATDSTTDSGICSEHETTSDSGYAANTQRYGGSSTTDPASDHEDLFTEYKDSLKSSSSHLRRVIGELLDNINEHQGILINQLDSVQAKKNNEDLEGRTCSTDRVSTLLPKDVPSDPEDTSDTDTVKGDSDEEESLDGQSKLEVCARVSVEGANLQIADTGVNLFIPRGALSEEQTIHMKIIPQPCDAQAALKFECNSVVVVELLPNNCRFQCPVSLTLPHCLQLKEEYERNSVDVLISHHDEGFKPKWEILHDAKFYLWKENCTISLHSFCWVTYEIHDTIVEAKRIKLYTAGKRIRLNDRIAEVEVGFYPDLPGSGKILELNKDMHLSQRKPYVFLKTGEEPLLINLHKVVPKEWNNSQPDENPKIIPFDSVSISEERSCPFVLERSGDDTDIPLCIFKVGQKGRNEVELTIRPDVLSP